MTTLAGEVSPRSDPDDRTTIVSLAAEPASGTLQPARSKFCVDTHTQYSQVDSSVAALAEAALSAFGLPPGKMGSVMASMDSAARQ